MMRHVDCQSPLCTADFRAQTGVTLNHAEAGTAASQNPNCSFATKLAPRRFLQAISEQKTGERGSPPVHVTPPGTLELEHSSCIDKWTHPSAQRPTHTTAANTHQSFQRYFH